MKAVLKGSSKIVYVDAVYEITKDCPIGVIASYRDIYDGTEYNPEDLLFSEEAFIEVKLWEQRRYEIAKDLYVNHDITATDCVRFADQLIKELKKD